MMILNGFRAAWQHAMRPRPSDRGAIDLEPYPRLCDWASREPYIYHAIQVMAGSFGDKRRENRPEEYTFHHSLRNGEFVAEMLELLPAISVEDKTFAIVTALYHDMNEDNGIPAELLGSDYGDPALAREIAYLSLPEISKKDFPLAEDRARIKRKNKFEQAERLGIFSLLGKAADNIDNPLSDLVDLQNGRIYLAEEGERIAGRSGIPVSRKVMRLKLHDRCDHHEDYVRRLATDPRFQPAIEPLRQRFEEVKQGLWPYLCPAMPARPVPVTNRRNFVAAIPLRAAALVTAGYLSLHRR